MCKLRTGERKKYYLNIRSELHKKLKRLEIRLLNSVDVIAENYGRCKITYKISLVMGKPVFGVSDAHQSA